MMRSYIRCLFKIHILIITERHLQFCNGLVWPVGVFDLVQLGLWEGVVEVLDGHLVEGDHVLELGQLMADGQKSEHFVAVPIRPFQTVAAASVLMSGHRTTSCLGRKWDRSI